MRNMRLTVLVPFAFTYLMAAALLPGASAAPRPNIVLILADDLGFSDLRCYGSANETPNVDRLAGEGLRFTQFYNCGRCCPTRASLLTGLYPHQAGVGHMLQAWQEPGYTAGLNRHCVTIAQLLRSAGYRTYHVGKWHVGGIGPQADPRNHPLNRGFEHAYGTAGGGGYFDLRPLYIDRENVQPDADFYATDAFTRHAVAFLKQHHQDHQDEPFFLSLCYTAPHFPLQAKPQDIAKYEGRFSSGWDALRQARFARQKELGILDPNTIHSPRDPIALPWSEVPDAEKKEWDLRMAVHAAMIDCMDQGIGRVLKTLEEMGAQENSVVLFLSDNGASAEIVDTWPNPSRGHKPGSRTGTRESHRCLEIGWANAANAPFRENKMWTHEGGISTPLIVRWPAGIKSRGQLTSAVGHVADLMPTLLELAGANYPADFDREKLISLAGQSLVPVLTGASLPERELAWEHEGNRAIRLGDLKLVAVYQGPWELYDLAHDRAETRNLAAEQPEKVAQLAERWQRWADRVGVVAWQKLPGSRYRPTKQYRKKSEPVAVEPSSPEQ